MKVFSSQKTLFFFNSLIYILVQAETYKSGNIYTTVFYDRWNYPRKESCDVIIISCFFENLRINHFPATRTGESPGKFRRSFHPQFVSGKVN